jgi:signal transduction histidine kinase/CheY-like chemotaxis protein
MSDADELISFLEDAEPVSSGEMMPPWKVAVIDDDPAVHEGTRFALYDYKLGGQGLEILSAHSARDGRKLLAEHPDVAVVLLDVVMETETAGLDLVGYIRNELHNETVRIILRTGQPGQAPERRVIIDYDINDYKAKTELTADKLFTSMTAALRSYQQLQRMIETRRGLEIIIEAASTLFDFHSMQRLAEGVLTQLASLLEVDCAGILVLREDGTEHESFSILAGSGCYRRFVGHADEFERELELRDVVRQACERRCHEFVDRRSVLYVRTGSGREVIVLLEAAKSLSDTNRKLVEVFSSRLSIAFDNVILYQQLQEANLRLEDRVLKRTAELKSANRRLAVQTAELRRANRFKTEILGTIAHDLKNPLGVIMGRSEMLSDLLVMQPMPEAQVRDQIRHVRDSAKRLTGMVDSLISDAMNDALDITVRREPLDLAALVADVVEANRPLADRKNQSISISGPDSLMTCGDQDRLWEAVDNLVSNAIKYTPSSGSVEIALAREGTNSVVRVRDNGPGLSPEDVGRVFGRFQRLSAKPTGGETSTGLGLSIAKRIVDLHRGRISAESAGPGQGATFTISLPDAE